MKRACVLVAMVIMCWILPAAAQDDRLSVTVYGGGLLPIGNFGGDIGKYAEVTRRFGFQPGEVVGLATMGGSAGVELTNPVLTEGLDWSLGVHVMMSPTDAGRVQRFFQHEIGDTNALSMTYGTWLNIPIFTGFRYSIDVADGFRVHGLLQGGLNLTQQASREAVVNGKVVERTTFDLMADFGFAAGIGVELFGSYSVSVRYYNFGTPKYEGTRTLNEFFFTSIPRREMSIDGDARQVEMVVVMLGYQL